MKWSGEQYKCRNCGEVYPYSLSTCSCGGVCEKIADASGQPVQTESEQQQNQNNSNTMSAEEQKIQHLADQLNQAQNRKTSLAFAFMILFGSSLRAKVNFYLLLIIIAVTVIALSLFCTFEIGEAVTYFIIVLAHCVIGGMAFYDLYQPLKLLLHLLKKGRFVVGHKDNNSQSVDFTDEVGDQHKTSGCVTTSGKDSYPYLVVYDKLKPDDNFALKASVNSQAEDIIEFRAIITRLKICLFDSEINYDLSNKSFIKEASGLWIWLAIMVLPFLACFLFAYFLCSTITGFQGLLLLFVLFLGYLDMFIICCTSNTK